MSIAVLEIPMDSNIFQGDISMDIYSILSSKPHNPHYLKRYIKFIEYFSKINYNSGEEHHICPKSSDLFPEYNSFADYPWNKIIVPPRVHVILHWILHKCYGGKQSYAYWAMINQLNPNNVIIKRTPPKMGTFYEKAKMLQSERMKLHNPMHDPEVLKKKSGANHHSATKPWTKLRNKPYNIPKETRDKQSEMMKNNNPMFNEQAKNKRSLKIKGRPVKKVECPNCGKLVGFGAGLKSHSKICN